MKGGLFEIAVGGFFERVYRGAGDKTQLATLLFATDRNLSRTAVFAASSAALVFSSLLAVLFGSQISRAISPSALRLVAGIGFIFIGTWMLLGNNRQ